jgi:hypothetical protein
MNRLQLLLAWSILLWTCPISAQEEEAHGTTQEARETLRFIRLAETRRSLNFPEETLIQLNLYLDDYERDRFLLTKKELRLKRQTQNLDLVEHPEQLLQEWKTLKQAQYDLDLKFLAGLEERLTSRQTIEFLAFYDQLKKKVTQRLRTLQDRKNRQPLRR